MNMDAATDVTEVRIDPTNLPDDLKEKHAVRFNTLDHNSLLDFTRGFKIWLSADGKRPEVAQEREAFLLANGSGTGPTNLSYEESFNLLLKQPGYAARTRLNWAIHDYMWTWAFRAFYADVDRYLQEMQETDHIGPGSLELNPDIAIPVYAIHEIHRQPGGFVGDPFAGWVYHYALSMAHYIGYSDHDEAFFQISQTQPVPADGKVNRILDMGCGPGQTTTGFKQRFPNAEVWGIDIGAPMVRYAHHRAVKLGLDVQFAQRLAEDSKFPDNHFDIVSDYLVFHEVNRETMVKICEEAFRILRPGGVFGHLDAPTAGHPTKVPPNDVFGKAMLWNIHRNNYEPFYLDYAELDLPSVLRQVGFELDLEGPAVLWNGRPRTVATKPMPKA